MLMGFAYKHISLSSALTLNASRCPVALMLTLILTIKYISHGNLEAPNSINLIHINPLSKAK